VSAELAARLWEHLATAGGSLALTFIVALFLGIVVMMLVFLVSAVVALERFARVPSGRIGRAVPLAVTSLAAGVAVAHVQIPELSAVPLGERWPLLAPRLAGGGVAVLSCALAVSAAMYFASGWALARASALWLGLGYALAVGSLARPSLAALPALLAGALAAVLAWRRRRANARRARDSAETILLWLTPVLLAGLALATGLPRPAEEIAQLGAALLLLFVSLVVMGLLPLAAAGFAATRRGFEWFVAVRYLVAKRRQTFISIITAICVAGIAAGVWLIITVLSVMNGFERTWRDEIIGNRAHFTVQSGLGPFSSQDELVLEVEAVEGVVAASPYLDAEGMVRGAGGEILAVRVRGIDPKRVGQVTDLREDLQQGSLEDLEGGEPGAPPGILIGSHLAGSLAVQVGDPITVISPFGGPQTPLGPAPRLTRFRVAGIFQSSFFQYDEVFTYVSLAAAQDFRRTPGVVDGLEVRTTDFYRSQRVAHAVETALGFPYYTRDWKEFFPAFFQALKSERIMMFLLLGMIMVVASFSIVATLVMMIMEKSSDIAILKAMGARDESIERIFAIEGMLIGLCGTLLGVVAGVAVVARIGWVQEQVEAITGVDTLPATVYQFSTLPAELDGGQIAISVAIAMILALGATLLPSRQGARIDPVEALRYE
jgi:lipoprotein-releasing system permease protein